MATKLRTLYVLREDHKAANGTQPIVYIDRVASGALVYGVKVTARSLKKARELAQNEFRALREFSEKEGKFSKKGASE